MNQKWKTLIISLLTPSSIISGIALIVLWGYFSRLGRLDIFFDVMNIKSILVLVCCATILSLAMIVFIFFITSFFIPVVIPQDINNLPAYNKIQGNFLSVMMLNGWLTIIMSEPIREKCAMGGRQWKRYSMENASGPRKI